jgi:hypothetical protein
MKIYQIITEDYDNFAAFRDTEPAKTPVKKDNPEKDAEKSDDSIVGQAKQKVQSSAESMPDIGIDLTTLALTGVTIYGVSRLSAAGLSKLSASYADKLIKTQQVTDMVTKAFGPWFALFRAFGIAAAMIQLYKQLYVLEAMYVQGKLPGDDGGHAKYVEQREFEFSVFITQILTPTLVKWTARAVASITGIKWAIRALGGVATYATAGTAILAVIATEAFALWLQNWLGTTAGRDVLFKWTGGMIRYIGKPADSLWDMIMDAYQSSTGKAPNKLVPGSYNQADVRKYGSQDAATAAQADRQAKADAGGLNNLAGVTAKTGFVVDPKNPTSKVIVTDKDGKLLSNIKLSSNPTLNLLRTQAINSGQPDPLTKFATPGQKLPPIPGI